MTRRAAVPVVCAALAFFSCAGSPTGPSQVAGIEWRLVSLHQEGSTPVAIDQPSRYRLRLQAGGRADVGADCNGCGGLFTLYGSALTISHLACTLMLCAPPSLAGEYLVLLDGPSRLTTEGARLTITSERGTLTFSR